MSEESPPNQHLPLESPRTVRFLGFDYITGLKTSRKHLVLLALSDYLMRFVLGREKAAPAPALDGKSIAVAKIDLLGDVLMITPVLRELRLQVPNATIALVVASWSEGAGRLALDQKLCDHLVIYDPPTMSPSKCSWVLKVRNWISTLRQAKRDLRDLATDVFIDLRANSPNSLLLARLAGIPHKAGFALRGFSYVLQQELPFDGTKPMGQLYLDSLKTLNLKSATYEKPVLEWKGEPAAAPSDFPRSDRVVMLHPFSRNPRKMLGGEWWAAVAGKLGEGRRIMILGTKSDLTNRELVDALTGAGCDFSLAGKTTFREAMGCIREAEAFVGVDSVFAHVALAYDKPAYVAATKGASYRLAFPHSNTNLFYDEVSETSGAEDFSSPLFQQYLARIGASSREASLIAS